MINFIFGDLILSTQLITKAKAIFLILITSLILSIDSSDARAEQGSCLFEGWKPKKFSHSNSKLSVVPLQFKELNGSEKNIFPRKNSGLVLNFWATWCAPCVEEMPGLEILHQALIETDIAVFVVSIDRGKAKNIQKLISKFFKKNNLEKLKSLWDEGSRTMKALKVRGVPTTIFINAKGHEVGRIEGISDYSTKQMENFVKKCLSSATE